MANSLRKCVSL